MNRKRLTLITFTAVLTAIVFVLTAYLHIPSHVGFVHIGDGVIYLAACLLPLPYALFVGAVGGALADLLSGFAIWAPATLLIKALGVLFFTRKRNFISVRNILGLIPASIVCVVGYYFYDALVIGNFVSAFAGVPGYAMQCVLSSALFVVCGFSLDKIGFKRKVLGEIKR